MSKMSEYHYSKQQNQDDPTVEYYMRYPEKTRWTPSVRNWYNKLYSNPENPKPSYIKAKKVRLPF